MTSSLARSNKGELFLGEYTGGRTLLVFLFFLIMGIYFLFKDPVISIELLVLSLYFLFSLMEKRGDRFPVKSYLILLVVLLLNSIFSFYMKDYFSIAIGLLNLLFALSTWLSYQQLKIDEREEHGE